jgi:hypothetical protein
VDQEFFKTEIRTLKEKLGQYERDAVEMGTSNTDLQGQLSKQKDDQKDIFEYLNGELFKKTTEIESLEERVLKLEEENDLQMREHDHKMRVQKETSDQELESLQDSINEYREQLEKVEAFIQHKASLEMQLAEKARALEDEKREHETHVSDLERKHVQEKDRLKKEMLLKLRETKANLLKMTDNQLDTTTKRTIAENEQMSSELAWQSKETEKLIRKNEKLIGENSTLKRELALHQQTQEEFAKKVHVYQKTIKTLLAKLNTVQASQQDELKKRHVDEEERDRRREEDQQKIDLLEEESVTLRGQLEQAQEEAEAQEGAHQELEAKHMEMLQLQDESVKFTLQCLKDMGEKFGREAADAEGETGSPAELSEQVSHLTLQALDASKREEVVAYLLEQLQAYQQQLRELELHRQWQQHSTHRDGQRLPPIGPPPGLQPEALQPGSSVLAVNGPVRPWGKRSKEHPLTRHTPSSFQRARQGHGGGTMMQ